MVRPRVEVEVSKVRPVVDILVIRKRGRRGEGRERGVLCAEKTEGEVSLRASLI